MVLTLSTQDNGKLSQQLKSNFEKTIKCNKYQLKVTTERQNEYLDYLSNPSFQGVSRLFVSSSEGNAVRTRHTRYFLPSIETKDGNIFINGKTILINHEKMI